MRNGFVLLILIALMLPACEPSEGDTCSIDSDCGPGMWCNSVAGECVSLDCANGECDVPDGAVAPTPSGEDEEIEFLKDRIEQLEEKVDDLAAGGTAGGEGGPCVPENTPENLQAWKVTSMAIGVGGVPGEGLDLDDNKDTCAPEDLEGTPCSDGIDNALTGLAGIVNKLFTDSLPKLALVYSPDCASLHLVEYTASETGDDADGNASPPELTLANTLSADHMENATLDGEELTTGTEGSATILIPLPFGGSILRAEGTEARFMGSVTDGTLNGILGTWITEFALDKALSVFSQADFEGTPRSTAKGIVMEFADRDEDGDGTPDAVSLGLKITAEPATLKLSGE